MKRSDFTEETIYVWTCPECGSFIEMHDDPDYEEYVDCDVCGKTFKIEDDD